MDEEDITDLQQFIREYHCANKEWILRAMKDLILLRARSAGRKPEEIHALEERLDAIK